MHENDLGDTRLVPVGDGYALSVMVAVPFGANGVVVFVDGLCRRFQDTAEEMIRRRLYESGVGSVVLRAPSPLDSFDPDSVSAESRRSVIDSGLACLGSLMVWLAEYHQTRDLRVGYFATDGAAAVALIAAADLVETVRAVVSVGGRPDLAGNALEWVGAPTLFVVAEDDLEVLAINELAFDSLEAEKELEILPGARHHMESREALEQVAELALGWFEEHLICVA